MSGTAPPLPDPADLRVAPLRAEHARAACTWRFESPYDCYDLTDEEPEVLLRPTTGMHALLAGERLVGIRSYGPDGQVPGWDYDETALDTGGSLHPDLVGRGLGRHAIAAGLAHGREHHAPPAFRVTVATFNTRALRVVESLGFAEVARFEATRDGRPFAVLVRPETPA